MRALSKKGIKKFLKNCPPDLRVLRTLFSAFKSKAITHLPLYVTFEISNACNLNCRMCIRNFIDRKNQLLSLETFKKIIDEVKPLYVGLTGYGEPLFNKDVFKMIKYCKQKNKRTIVKLFTNAMLLNREVIFKLISAGLDILTISLESPSELNEKIRINSKIDKIKSNIAMINSLSKGKLEVDINTVVMKDNAKDLKNMIDFVHKHKNSFTLAPMTIYGKADNLPLLPSNLGKEKLITYLDEAIGKAAALGERDVAKDIEAYKKIIQERWDNFAEGKLFAKSACFVPWLTCYVATNGDVYPCCYFYEGGVKYGNIREKSFNEIWNSKVAQEFRKSMVENGRMCTTCATCPENDDFLFKLFKYLPLKFLSQRKY
jgi:radical SAM protein with 4Fe4S-binding SPASM domain